MSYSYYNGQEYKSRPPLSEVEGFMLASAVSGAILSPLAYVGKPFLKHLEKEEINNSVYKDCFERTANSELFSDLGVKVIPAQNQIINNMYKEGTNACFIPSTKQVLINTDKIAIAGFHELGHALNALKSKYGVKYLAKMRGPGYAIAGLMEYFAIFSRSKPKGAKRNVTDVIEDNCGKIAFAAMLPVVAEEAIASHRGIKLAKASGLSKEMIKSMKSLYTKALATYGARAALGGFAVYISRKIMDYFTRPRLVKQDDYLG